MDANCRIYFERQWERGEIQKEEGDLLLTQFPEEKGNPDSDYEDNDELPPFISNVLSKGLVVLEGCERQRR